MTTNQWAVQLLCGCKQQCQFWSSLVACVRMSSTNSSITVIIQFPDPTIFSDSGHFQTFLNCVNVTDFQL